ncbi:MAG: hypothetical protein J6V74_02495, partial [Bacteroidales bacterium]|nr:hypothetical protein [Bacteroidales bacterium]
MKRTKLIISALLLAGVGAFAQQAEQPAADKPAVEQEKKLVTPSGFLQAGYTYTDANTSTFLLRRARIVLQGDLYKGKAGKFDYKLQLEV